MYVRSLGDMVSMLMTMGRLSLLMSSLLYYVKHASRVRVEPEPAAAAAPNLEPVVEVRAAGSRSVKCAGAVVSAVALMFAIGSTGGLSYLLLQYVQVRSECIAQWGPEIAEWCSVKQYRTRKGSIRCSFVSVSGH